MRPLLALVLLAGYAAALNDYWGKFCGKHNCYEALGLEANCTMKDVKRAYRTESLKWHPDKVPKERKAEANAKFQVLSKAYAVLSDEEQRQKYDYYLEHPDEYWVEFGHAFFTTFAPKSNTVFVLLALLVFFSIVTYASQHTKYNERLYILTAMIVRGRGLDKEMMAVRRKGLEMRDGKVAGEGKDKKRGKVKDEEDPLLFACVREVLMQTAIEGARKPDWKQDVLAVYLVLLFVDFWKWGAYEIKWQYRRRVLNAPLTDEEKAYLYKKQLGKAAWEYISDEDKKNLMSGEVTVEQIMEELREEAGRQQRANLRRRRKDKGSDEE